MKQYSIKNPPELPASCPPLPEGFVCLGLGGGFALAGDSFPGLACSPHRPHRAWCEGDCWDGDAPRVFYAAPEGSEIVRLNFGEPLGSWADKLPRECVDLIVERFNAYSRDVALTCNEFILLFLWCSTPEGHRFWNAVDEFITGVRPTLPPIPAELQPVQIPQHSLGVIKEKPLTTAERVRRIEKKLAEQDALLASIQKLIADFNATNA